MPPLLPSGDALAALAAAVADGALRTDPAELAEFRDPYAHDGASPAAVVVPRSVEEVQAVVRAAAAHGTALWPISQGRNNGYGGPAPRMAGSVVVSLREMDRVLHIDEELAYAVVEPGVRFLDLHAAIHAAGARVVASTPDLGWGSVIGNTLDHGLGYTPYGDHAAASCGLEVVLPDGSLLRTGMGGLEGGSSWHVHPRGFGPDLEGLFGQSGLGIVTKMGMWLMPTPECYMACGVSSPGAHDAPALIDALRPLLLRRVIENVPVLANALTLAAGGTPRTQWHDGDGLVPDAAIDRIVRELGIGRWNLRFALYGPEAVVQARFAEVEQAFAAVPGARVEGRLYAGDTEPGDVPWFDQVQIGIPNLQLLDSLGWRGDDGGHLGFSPVGPLTGAHLRRQEELLRPIMERHGHDYMGGIACLPRSFTQIFAFIYDRSDAAQVDSAFAACREMITVAAQAGYGEYRAHLDVMDLVADQYGFGDHAQRRVLGTIKDALDPAGILAPGKQGVWPARLR